MNFRIFYLFVLFLVVSNVLANLNKQYTIDIDETSSFTLPKGDILVFKWPTRNYMLPNASNEDILTYIIMDKEEKITIREIDSLRNRVYFTVFIEDSETPYYPSIDFNQYLKLDFEKDGLNDLIIRLNKIEGNNVTISFEKIDNRDKVGDYNLILKKIKKDINNTEANEEDMNINANDFFFWRKFNFRLMNINWYIVGLIVLILFLIMYNKRDIIRLYRRIKKF